MFDIRSWSKQANIIADVLSKAPNFDKTLRIGKDEFQRRQKAVYEALAAAGFDGGIVYSDEHYHGDVPYLGGNTNISVEPVSGIVGKNGFAILAGLEGLQKLIPGKAEAIETEDIILMLIPKTAGEK